MKTLLSWPYGAILAGVLGGGYGTYEGGHLAMTTIAENVTQPIQRFSERLTSHEHESGKTIWLTIGEASSAAKKRREIDKAIVKFCGWLASKQQHSWSHEAREALGLCENRKD